MRLTPVPASDRLGHCPWQIAEVRGVERTALRARLGEPAYVETDAARTFGGEEDWWGYRDAEGVAIGLCLRVPYEHLVVKFSRGSQTAIEDVRALLAPWRLEVHDSPHFDGPSSPVGGAPGEPA